MSPDNSLLVASRGEVVVATARSVVAVDDVVAVVGVAATDDVVVVVGSATMVFVWVQQC